MRNFLPGQIKLSIVIPCFNQGAYLMEALQSVEQCAVPGIETLIVNDGSTEEETCRLLKALGEQGHHIIHQTNRGLSTARNVGVQKAKGPYVLPLDADNKIRPNFVLKGVRILDRHSRVGVVYGRRFLFGSNTGVLRVPRFDLARLLACNFIDACSLFRRSVWEECGGFDETMRSGLEDWEFWIRVASRGWKFYRLDEVVFDYRVRPDSMLSHLYRSGGFDQVREYIYQKHRQLVLDRSFEIGRLKTGTSANLMEKTTEILKRMFTLTAGKRP